MSLFVSMSVFICLRLLTKFICLFISTFELLWTFIVAVHISFGSNDYCEEIMALLLYAQRHMRRERIFRGRQNPLYFMPDEDIMQTYRLPRDRIIHVCGLVDGGNHWGRQSCRPLNRVPSLPSLMVLRLTHPVCCIMGRKSLFSHIRTNHIPIGWSQFPYEPRRRRNLFSSCCLNIYYRVFIM